MPTIPEIQLLVKSIVALSNSLPKSVPHGTTKDKIWAVMHNQEGETAFETFNKRFDALFGEDCRNSDGRLHHIRQGKNGMGLICAYLNQIKWSSDIPLDLVEIKLIRLSTELGYLRGSDADEPVVSTRPSRQVNPSSKLADADNSEQPQLSFQRKAVETLRTRKVPDVQDLAPVAPQPPPLPKDPIEPALPAAPSTTPSRSSSLNDLSTQSDNSSPVSKPTRKRSISAVFNVDSTTNSENDTDDEAQPKPSKKKRNTLGNPTATDGDGILADIDVQEIDDEEAGTTREEKRRDVDHFFHPANRRIINGKSKLYRTCKLCPNQKMIVPELTTMRRHLQFKHDAKYRAWAKMANFESRLPRDVQGRRNAADKAATRTLDRDLTERKLSERVIPYSHKGFCQAAIEWLISTDQPVKALEHPKFEEMINIASRATNGIIIPGRKATRTEIKRMFKSHLMKLKARFNGPTVKGKVNLTCDAWQASNTDGYFAVTGHWIEEMTPNQWELKSALLGFIRVNNAHNGQRLGQVLFKVLTRVGINHKVGHVTCDNASNNQTMLRELAARIKATTGDDYNWKAKKINCLAHVINLATQALIGAYSKSPHFDPKSPDSHIPTCRDEVGLIRAIVVKERSSSKRKEMWRMVQSKAKVDNPIQLVLDMKVRWSSTFLMLDRAERRKECIDNFVDELRWDEANSEKRDKIRELKLNSEEWGRVRTFLSLLSHADNAQQAFSSDNVSTLNHAIPALEALHNAWASRVERSKYTPFAAALNVACETIDTYYEKTTDSPAYIMAMVLDPREKLGYFKKHWSAQLQLDVKKCVEEVFKDRWLALRGQPTSTRSPKPVKSKLNNLLRELSDDDDNDLDGADTAHPSVLEDPKRPWLKDFQAYFDTTEYVPDGWTTTAWWGFNAHRHPVWSSLALDYLSIMASSVSSERAFSQGGITISKRRSRLKGDIVEALQCIKCAIRHDLLFREAAPSSVLEIQLELEEDGEDQDGDENDGGALEINDEGWDELVIEEDDHEAMDVDSE